MGLVSTRNVATPLRAYPASGTEYGTYAQTLLRSGYVDMLGRPPFNYSDGSAMRKSGFLSAPRLLNGKGQTIFVPCKTVKQCFQVL